MTRVFRYDLAVLTPEAGAPALAPPVALENGWLRCEGALARTGIQLYEDETGKQHRELRLPEEVFSPESMKSFELVPLTNQHPPVLLDATNTSTYQVGNVGEKLRRDGDWMVGPIIITSSTAIADAKNGRAELSNGYTCELDGTQIPELVAKYGPYDFIQRKIVGNHAAHVDAARAGKNARLRLDSGAARMIDPQSGKRSAAPTIEPERTDTMPIKLRLDNGATIDSDAPDLQGVLDRQLAALREDAAKKLLAEKERADASEKRAAILKANGLRLVKSFDTVRSLWDAMKSRDVACDECAGVGKIDGVKCDWCDGKGTVKAHEAMKAMAPAEGDEDAPDDEDMDEAMEAGLDETELEVAQETEQAAGKAAKGDSVSRRKQQRKLDAAEEKKATRKLWLDSRARQIHRGVAKRIDLELAARRFLDETDVPAAELAKLDEAGIAKAVVLKLDPDAKLDGKSPLEIRAIYDHEVRKFGEFTADDAVAMASRGIPQPARIDGARGGAQARNDFDPSAAKRAHDKRLDEQAKAKKNGAQAQK